MILQRYYGVGDQQVEYQIVYRTSFKGFLGLETGDKVPHEKTVWAFLDKMTETGLIDEIFTQFITYLESKELIFNEKQIVDTSFTTAPRQRNTREENEKINNGQGDELLNEKPTGKAIKI